MQPYLVMGEINIFRTLNLLNQLLCKMVNLFKTLVTPRAGDVCWSEW